MGRTRTARDSLASRAAWANSFARGPAPSRRRVNQVATPMTSAFDELLDLSRRLGITVRHARLAGAGGGLATPRGQRQLFIDLDAAPDEQLDQTASALANLPEIDNLSLRPDVRQL